MADTCQYGNADAQQQTDQGIDIQGLFGTGGLFIVVHKVLQLAVGADNAVHIAEVAPDLHQTVQPDGFEVFPSTVVMVSPVTATTCPR